MKEQRLCDSFWALGLKVVKLWHCLFTLENLAVGCIV